jgi:hypothetical protein
MDSLWRVRWQCREKSGYGSVMSRAEAVAAAARSNAIDPAIAHWAEPIPEQEAALLRGPDIVDPAHHAG